MPQTFTDVDFFRKTALVRVDANVRVTGAGTTEYTAALDAIQPTLMHITKAGGRVVLMGHRGHPAGKPQPNRSLRPLAKALSKHTGKHIRFTPDCIGRGVEQAIEETPFGEALMLENTRFHAADELGDATFAANLAAYADVFVLDTLAVAHFEHASTAGVMDHLPSTLGLHAQEELTTITTALKNPKKPLLAIVGGAKLSTRQHALQHLLLKADMLLLGGGVANTFLAAKDINVGRSLIEPACIETARDMLAEAGIVGCRMLLPQDAITGSGHELILEDNPNNKNDLPAEGTAKAVKDMGNTEAVLDIGPETAKTWHKVIQSAGTIVWLGAVGMHEKEAFREGSHAVADALAASNATSIVSGSDTIRCLIASNNIQNISCITTADKAFLSLLAGDPLIALERLGVNAQ